MAKYIEEEETYECQADGCTNEIETPKMCCDGRECGCMGMPIEPPVCSEECRIVYMKQKRLWKPGNYFALHGRNK